MSIATISRSFVWENCATILPATVIIIPLAIEVGCFLKISITILKLLKKNGAHLKLSYIKPIIEVSMNPKKNFIHVIKKM